MQKNDDKEFYNCSNDLAFKKVFSNKKVLSLFLTSFWNKTINEEDITILNNESIGEKVNNKIIFFDVNSKVIDGNTQVILNLEMQRFKPTKYNLFDRALQYFSRNKNANFYRGENYNLYDENVKTRTECIMFTGFDILDLDEWIYETAYQYKNMSLTEDRIYYIPIENYKKCPIIEIKEALECFLINKPLESFNTSLGRKAGDILMEINDDEDMRTLLYKRKLDEYYYNIEINGLKKDAEITKEEIKTAKEENNKLKENNRKTVLNLSSLGLKDTEIANACNMPLDEVKSILESK